MDFNDLKKIFENRNFPEKSKNPKKNGELTKISENVKKLTISQKSLQINPRKVYFHDFFAVYSNVLGILGVRIPYTKAKPGGSSVASRFKLKQIASIKAAN